MIRRPEPVKNPRSARLSVERETSQQLCTVHRPGEIEPPTIGNADLAEQPCLLGGFVAVCSSATAGTGKAGGANGTA